MNASAHPPVTPQPWRIVYALAMTQIVAYGSLFYAIAVLAPAIQAEMGWRYEIVFGAFSLSLLIAGLTVAPAGALVDRFGGRRVMASGSVLAALGMVSLFYARETVTYFFSWSLLGLAMGSTLYECAFATINREFASNARRAISVLTLFGGLASTFFWPLTLYLSQSLGWRGTCLSFAAMHLFICFPLHLSLRVSARPRHDAPLPQPETKTTAAPPVEAPDFSLREALLEKPFWWLALSFAANMFTFSAMSVYLIPLLQKMGHPIGVVLFLTALIGPMQVAGRLGEMTLARHIAPVTVGRFTFALLPASLLALLMAGQQQWVAALFCALYGMSNGIVTIVRGTVPQQLFGRRNYGAIAGALAGPTMAAGPLVLAVLLENLPSDRWVLAALMVAACVSFLAYVMALRAQASA